MTKFELRLVMLSVLEPVLLPEEAPVERLSLSVSKSNPDGISGVLPKVRLGRL